MVKKILFLVSLTFLTATFISAQRLAIVDINGVLESMAEYKTAQGELDKIAAEWRQEIAKQYDKIKSMYNKYQAEQVLLSDDIRRQREDEIMEKEKEVRELQKVKFGPEGELFQKRQELVAPIQDKVYAAVEGFADDRGYELILDKGGSAGIIFYKPELDKTEDVQKRLGIE